TRSCGRSWTRRRRHDQLVVDRATPFPIKSALLGARRLNVVCMLRRPAMTAPQTFKVVGTRPIRHDGMDKVTGRAIYGADFQIAGLLHGAILRSPHAHARIRRIDASKAAALAGVEAVVTSADLHDPGSRIAELGEGAINLRHL